MDYIAFAQNEGLDHVAVCVRALTEAQKTYEDLGFQLYPRGKHQDYGTENSGAWFANDTYVELLTYFDASKAAWLAHFLEKHEGAFFLVLRVPSVMALMTYFQGRGVEVGTPVPGTWQQEGEESNSILWYSLFLPRTSLPGNLLFFIEYTEAEQLSRDHPKHPTHFSTHPNGAQRLSSVWVAVEDLSAASKQFENLGFHVGATESFNEMKAKKQVIDAGKGVIYLIAPAQDHSPVKKFLELRGEGIFGCTIEVDNLSHLKESLSRDKIMVFEEDKSLLLKPEMAHGMWIEFKKTNDDND